MADEEPIPLAHKVGKATTALVVPSSRMTRQAVTLAWTDAGEQSELRLPVCAAALALCDAELGAHLRKAGIRFNGDIRELGYTVVDFLTGLPDGKDATMDEIQTAGSYAVALCWRTRRAEEAAAAARSKGFTTPSSDASSSNSSTSSKPGDGIPAGWAPSTPTSVSG